MRNALTLILLSAAGPHSTLFLPPGPPPPDRVRTPKPNEIDAVVRAQHKRDRRRQRRIRTGA